MDRKILVQMVGALMRWSTRGRFATRTVRKEVRKIIEGIETAEEARAGAIARAKRSILDEVGRYLESQGGADEGTDAEDRLALSSGLVQSELVKSRTFRSRDGEGVRIVVKGRVSTIDLDRRVRRLLADRMQIERLKATQRRNTRLLEQYAKLEEANRKAGPTPGPALHRKIRKGLEDTTRQLAAQDWLERVQSLWNGVEYRDAKLAIDYINEAIALVPDYPVYYFYRGNANYYWKQDVPAIRDYSQAIELDERYAEAYNNRGNVHYRREEYPKAIADYERAIRCKADYADAFNNRANAYYKQTLHESALKNYAKALELDPQNALYHNNRAITYDAMGETDQALADYTRALALDPELAIALSNRGRTRAVRGEHREALADFNEAIRVDSRLADAWFERGNAYQALGNKGAARRDWRKAAKLGHPEARARAR